MNALVLCGATSFGQPHFSGDILWRTNFKAPDPVILIEIEGKSYLIVSPLELERAEKEAEVDEVVNIRDYGETEAEALGMFLKKYKVKNIVVPDTFNYQLGKMLENNFKVVAVAPPFYPGRAVKNDWEVSEIEKAQRVAEQAIEKAMEVLADCIISGRYIIRPPDFQHVLTSEYLRALIDFKLYSLGFIGVGTTVACGLQAADPHCAGSGSLSAFESIVMSVSPMSMKTHYWADLTRTVFKGEPSEELKKMYGVVLKAQEHGIEMTRPGIDGKEIYDWTIKYFKNAGYPSDLKKRPMEGFFHGVGHGVGIDIHEASIIGRVSCILREGNVVTVEPGLYYQRARGHIPVGGIRTEDMILITKNGCRNLTKFPKNIDDMIVI